MAYKKQVSTGEPYRYYYQYRIYFNHKKQGNVVVSQIYSSARDKDNRKKKQFYKMIAVFKTKPNPYITPVLTDPFTVRDGSNRILFQLDDPFWIAVVTQIMLTKS